jgi:hypothetical protein
MALNGSFKDYSLEGSIFTAIYNSKGTSNKGLREISHVCAVDKSPQGTLSGDGCMNLGN